MTARCGTATLVTLMDCARDCGRCEIDPRKCVALLYARLVECSHTEWADNDGHLSVAEIRALGEDDDPLVRLLAGLLEEALTMLGSLITARSGGGHDEA